MGPKLRLQKLVCTDCMFTVAGSRSFLFERSISTFESLRELSLSGSSHGNDAFFVFLQGLDGLQKLETLTLSHCDINGLSDFLASVPLQSLHLSGSISWGLPDSENESIHTFEQRMPQISSETLRNVHFGIMNPELALSFDISELPSLQKVSVGSFITAFSPDSEPECLELSLTCLSTLPLCIEDGFEVHICGNEGDMSKALGALMRLQNALRGKRVVIIATNVSTQMVHQLSMLSEVVQSLILKANTFSGNAMVQAARAVRGLLSIDVKVVRQVPVQAIAALLAAAQRNEPFCLRLNLKSGDERDSDYTELWQMSGGASYVEDVCCDLPPQWSEVKKAESCSRCFFGRHRGYRGYRVYTYAQLLSFPAARLKFVW